MIPIDPNSESTLLLNSYYHPIGFISAKDSIRLLINNTANGIDASGNSYPWKNFDVKNISPSWENNSIKPFKDHPCLRTSNRFYFIPTVLVLKDSFNNRISKSNSISLRKLYRHYNGICQYCLEKIPYELATQDHWFPKHKGGTNHDFNLVLACKSCNGKKSNKFPYYNVLNQPVKPRPIIHNFHELKRNELKHCRTEWKPYLYS